MIFNKRTQKAALSLLSCLSLLGMSSAAYGLSETGNGVLLLDLKGGIQYDSNVFSNSEELSDMILKFTPELRYVQDRGLISMEAGAGVDVGMYDDFDRQDYEDLFFDFLVSGYHREASPFDFGIGVSWKEDTYASQEVGDILSSDIAEIFAIADMETSDKFGVRGGLYYEDRSYDDNTFPDSKDTSLRLDAVHYYSPKLNLTSGYRYRDVSYSGNYMDYQTDTLVFGADGDISEKVTGVVELGYVFQDGNLDDFFMYRLGLTWDARGKTTVSLEGGRDNTVSLSGRSVISTDITLSVNQRFTETVKGSVFLTYGEYDREEGLAPRNDDFYRIGASADVAIAQSGSLRFSLSYEDRDSNYAISVYSRLLAYAGAVWTF